MRQQLFFMTATHWRRRSASKRSGGFLRNRRETLRGRERTSPRLLFAWAEKYSNLFMQCPIFNRYCRCCHLYCVLFECFFFPQKKAFQEDRAAWLKSQFLNMTPFSDRQRCSSSDGQSALSISKSVFFFFNFEFPFEVIKCFPPSGRRGMFFITGSEYYLGKKIRA